jgi:hypothetical protein
MKSDISKCKLQTSEVFLNLKYTTGLKYPVLQESSSATG